MRINGIAFAAEALASSSYILLYWSGIGYPFAGVSVGIFFVRLFIGLALLIKSRKTHFVAIAGTPLGIVYAFLSYIASGSFIVVLPVLLEAIAAGLATMSLSRIGREKQPSPLDMPVYG